MGKIEEKNKIFSPAVRESLVRSLKSLAYNLWWTWNPDAAALFQELSPLVWEQSNHSAVAVLKRVSDTELRARLGDNHFATRVHTILEEFSTYIHHTETWCVQHAPHLLEKPVAYFSAEFGLHECLPIYSGGLGVLAGDFAKSASDLGISFVGVSLFYRLGYFKQRVSADGWQEEEYPPLDPSELPIRLLVNEYGNPIETTVNVGHSVVKLRAWRIRIGRGEIILLDSNHPDNELHFRELTGRVYGGDVSTRIMQEIILGIGGVRILRSLGIHPQIFHMNEGHSAFLTLELLREQIAGGIPKAKAEVEVKKQCVFTTHTPVPAGHDRFPQSLIEYQLSAFAQKLKFSIDQLMAYGRINEKNKEESFCMTVLALKLSRIANAVSELHGKVSRDMWKQLYPNLPVDKIPIVHVTNGVHTPGWGNFRAHEFWNKRLDFDWTDRLMDKKYWEKFDDHKVASDEELWALRCTLRRELIEFVRMRVSTQNRERYSLSVLDNILSPDALTIGFARRFATYKRAPLIFTNPERLASILNNPQMPVQIIFAGKAHPRDDEGKKFIQRIIQFTRDKKFSGKIIFLENYDVNVARYLVSGSDIWLNTPRRPLEASGTSGMKITIHGGLHFSTLDGWWVEANNGNNGWTIGNGETFGNEELQDAADAESLLQILENEIVPDFYNRDENEIPRSWIKRIRNSMKTLIPEYSSDRMVAEYVEKCYKL
ncbi:MAG: alpha-glucan family phosphorylase [Bacteroidota bacterium]|nr:alpha-glucan family phosphorylase [Bacteroidota bacterium]